MFVRWLGSRLSFNKVALISLLLVFLTALSLAQEGRQSRRRTRGADTPAVSNRNAVFLGLGIFSENIAKVASNVAGDRAIFSRVFLEVHASGRFPVGDQLLFSPLISITPMGRLAVDGATQNRYFILIPALGWNLAYLDVKGGLGMLFYSMSGGGGSVLRNDGNSADTFYLPNRSATSRALVANLGVGGPIPFRNDEKAAFRWDFDFIVPGFLTTRRAFHFLLNVSYDIL